MKRTIDSHYEYIKNNIPLLLELLEKDEALCHLLHDLIQEE